MQSSSPPPNRTFAVNACINTLDRSVSVLNSLTFRSANILLLKTIVIIIFMYCRFSRKFLISICSASTGIGSPEACQRD